MSARRAVGHDGPVTDDGARRGLVLVVEDERAIADLVRLYLSRDGFGVHVEHDGAAGLAAARRLRPVACVLDIALPGMAGTEICRRLREAGDWTPVIFLTARDDEVDRIVGLELGADDYVTKPFSPRELVARVRAVLRRTGAAARTAAERPRASGPLTLDPGRRGGHRRRRAGAAHLHRVRPAGPPDRPPRPGVHPGGAAGRGLGLRGARRHPYGRRARRPGPGQAGRRRRADPHPPRRRLRGRCD